MYEMLLANYDKNLYIGVIYCMIHIYLCEKEYLTMSIIVLSTKFVKRYFIFSEDMIIYFETSGCMNYRDIKN